jgi:predicted RecB family nuclease
MSRISRVSSNGRNDLPAIQLNLELREPLIGKSPMRVRTEDWVSKTDLIRFLRCPYAFYLLDRGLISFPNTVDETQKRLIQQGVEFQASVEATAVPRAIDSADLPSVFANESIRLFGIPVLENENLKIYGRPDGVDTAKGALFPVEIKSHYGVQFHDKLELAFYWMLLEPYRSRTASPRGYLLLRQGRRDKSVEVELRPSHFERVNELLEDIRQARLTGVRPRICDCAMCSGLKRDEIRAAALANKDLTLISDIGMVRARHLEKCGIANYDDLLAADSAAIVEKLRHRKCGVSVAQVERWKHHAASFSTSRPVLFGNPPPLNGSFLALDLEYGPGPFIWLVGICIVSPGRREHLALWADTAAEEKNNLRCLAKMLEANPSIPLVTWSGNSADMPQLHNAAQRQNLGKSFKASETRHVDLYQYSIKAVRFPTPELGLKNVATYFGIPRKKPNTQWTRGSVPLPGVLPWFRQGQTPRTPDQTT